MADTPQFLTLSGNRDSRAWVVLAARRVLFSLLTLIFVAAAVNVFGQQPRATTTTAGAASLEVFAPIRLRGGLFYEGRFTIRARREIARATLVLDRGWLEQMHINTIEPSPIGEASRDGKLALDFGHVAAGDFLVAYLQFQVNPTNVGRRSQDVDLYDGTELLARVERTVTVFP